MLLQKLSLRDFRGFASLDLQFEPDVTVLVGVNGAGKTSILDAIARALSVLPTRIRGEEVGTLLSQDDIRIGAPSARVEVSGEVAGTTATWWLSAARPGQSFFPIAFTVALNPVIDTIRRSLDGAPHLPLAVHFPTNRAALDIPARIRTPHEFDPLSAYDGALEEGASNFRGFFEWYREEEDVYNEETIRTVHEERVSRLPDVRRAIEKLFPGASDLRVERRPQRMTLLHHGVRLDVAQLSDGEKCLLAMAGDLARRMVLAAPGVADPLAEPAVVLIDEVELHLHPGLQRTILVRLREVFPNTQFIVSTHSPQVLSSVRSTNVQLLQGFAIKPLERGTWRRDTNRILESAFGDPGRDPDVAAKLVALRDAVDEERHPEAWKLVRELRGLIEGEDPDLFFLTQLLPVEETNGATS